MSDYRYQIVKHNGIPSLHVMIEQDASEADNLIHETHIPIDDIEASIKQHREEQTTVDEPTNEPTTEPTQATDTPLLQKISERAQQGLDQGVILAREAYAALRDIIEMCKEG